jgi:hypothetical protein
MGGQERRAHSASSAADTEILIVSSCTKRKTRMPGDATRVPAADLYCGEQHRRLMEGVGDYRRAGEPAGEVRLLIVSAGLGLLNERDPVCSYDETFAGLPGAEIDRRANALGIPAAIAGEMRRPRALTILALGDDYLRACALQRLPMAAAPALALTGRSVQRRLPGGVIAVALGSADTERFRAGMVGLKGAVVAEMVRTLARRPMLVHNPDQLVRQALAGNDKTAP